MYNTLPILAFFYSVSIYALWTIYIYSSVPDLDSLIPDPDPLFNAENPSGCGSMVLVTKNIKNYR
jgi:hypothetical protein